MIRVRSFVSGHAVTRAAALGRPGWGRLELPARFFLLEWEDRRVLFDTGYGPLYFAETRSFPARLLRWLIPARIEGDAASVLAAAGVDPASVDTVILSHLHPDHAGGARCFPGASLIASRAEWEACRRLGPLGRVRAAFLPGLLPKNFAERMVAVESFPRAQSALLGPGWDLFGNGEVLAIPLPGHTDHQFGLLVAGERPIFLVADACYLLAEITESAELPWLTRQLSQSPSRYAQTIARLREVRTAKPNLLWANSHDPA